MKKNNSFLFVLASAFLLIGCAKTTPNVILKTKRNADNLDSFSVTTDLSTVKEIHTAQQKEYLSYDGEYVSIPEANYPDGQKHLSDPEPVKLEWNFEVPSGKTLSRYDVVVGKEADLSDGYAIKGTAAGELDIYNSYLGNNYFKIVANYSDGTSDSSKIQKYEVDDIYPRNLKIDGMTNCRDMGGGRVLSGGGHIKQGLIFRTSAVNNWAYGRGDVPDRIADSGKEELLTRLGCKTEINVNNSGNNEVGVQNYIDAFMYYGNGKHHMYRNSEPLKQAFHALANPDNYPVFYHCRIGTDRTGFMAIMLGALLGVSENEIYQDYLFSNFGNIQEKRYIGEKAGRDNILKYMDDLKTYPGEKLHNKAYNFLISIGIPASELDSIIDILVEGDKPENYYNHQEVIMAEEFEADGTEMKEIPATATGNASRAHPKKYYTLGADQSITVEFDPDYSGEAKLLAYLGAPDSNSTTSNPDNRKIAESISLEFDYNEVEIDEITFADAGFGQAEGRTFYAPVTLATVDVVEGTTIVTITGIANNLNIGAVSLIPIEQIADKEPDTPTPTPEPTPAKKGCGGSIMVTGISMAVISLSGLAILALKRRKED